MSHTRRGLFAISIPILPALWLLPAAWSPAVTITNVAVKPAYFSPNGDGVQDTSTVTATISPSSATWTVNVRKPGNTIVRTGTGSGASLSYTWDGKNGSNQVQADAVYTFELIAQSGGQATATATTTLDRTLPTATITAPASGATLSNVYQNGVSDVNVTGTASDANISLWQVDNGAFVLANGVTSITSGTLATWATLGYGNQSYTLRLQVWDKAGNSKTVSRPETVANFKATQNANQVNVATGGTVTYTSTIPSLPPPALKETLFIKNEAGQTVTTIVNAATRSAGTWPDPWNGKNGATLLPDGAYFYLATVTDGTHSMTWDLTSQFFDNPNTSYSQSGAPDFDPFNNAPMIITYTPGGATRIQIAFGLGSVAPPVGCPPPAFCFIKDHYEDGGTHTVYWPGTDSAGAYRGLAQSIGVYGTTSNFSQNAVVVYGTKPRVTTVTATPVMFGPSFGSQTISFTLSTYLSQSATVAVSFLNQASMSTLRTINLGAQTAGVHTAAWDGKADNGMLVAPGSYLVGVKATDSIGNVAVGQIMTTVQY